MLAVLLGALFLFAAVPAQAQTAHPVSNLAAAPGNGQLTVTWTNPSGAGAGVTEVYIRFRMQDTSTWQSAGTGLAGSITSRVISNLTNGTTYEIEVRLYWAALAVFANWESTTGTPRDPTAPIPTVDVWLSLPASLSVREGESITVTAHLSEAPSNNVTIPITLKPSTAPSIAAEPEDYGALTSITINAGQTTGTGTIATNHDEDIDNEVLYVEINPSLSSSIGRDNPYIVGFTIIDDDRPSTTTTTDPPTTTPTDPSPPTTTTPTNQPTDRQTPPALSSDATLNNIEIEEASLDFDPDTRTYTVNVYGVTAVTLTPTANHPDAEITVNGNTVQRGSSAMVALDNDGETSIEIEVTAENGTTKTYTLAVMYCPGEEREILSMFYDSTEGDMWEEDRGWNTESLLDSWHGVETENGSITVISLPDNRLSGEVPEALGCFGGLKELQELDLSGNSGLSGELPPGLSELNNLGVLDIRCTEITVPEELEGWTMNLGEGFRRGCDTQPDDMASAQGDGGCAVGASSERMGASALLVAVFMLFALSRGLRARSD